MASVASIERCLDALEILSGEAEGLPLGVIADRLSLPKSATHRLLAALVHRSFAIQDTVSQHYTLSFRLAQLGFRRLDALRFPEVAQPILDRLAAETGEHVRLAVVEGRGMVWIARAQGTSRGLRYDPEMGQGVVLHATATGKAWLATLPEDEALAIVLGRGFEVPIHFGRRAVRTVTALRQHLAETHRRGYGLAIEEGEAGTAAIAAIVRNGEPADAPVVGTISVAGPLGRLAGQARAHAVERLLAATREMSIMWPVRRRQRIGSPVGEVSVDGGRAPAAARLKRMGTAR